MCLKGTVARWTVVWTVMELIDPRVGDVGPDFALGPMNLCFAQHHVLEVVDPMMSEMDFGQEPVPMDSN